MIASEISEGFLNASSALIESFIEQLAELAPEACSGASDIVRAGGMLKAQFAIGAAGIVDASVWLIAPNGQAIELGQLPLTQDGASLSSARRLHA